MMKKKVSKKKWVKPNIKSLKFNKTLGGPNPSDPEGTTFLGST